MNTDNCHDQDPLTSCTSAGAPEAPEPSITFNFNCADAGTSLGTLTALVVHMDPSSNASDYELVLKNRFGGKELNLSFSLQQGRETFTFQLNNNTAAGDG